MPGPLYDYHVFILDRYSEKKTGTWFTVPVFANSYAAANMDAWCGDKRKRLKAIWTRTRQTRLARMADAVAGGSTQINMD